MIHSVWFSITIPPICSYIISSSDLVFDEREPYRFYIAIRYCLLFICCSIQLDKSTTIWKFAISDQKPTIQNQWGTHHLRGFIIMFNEIMAI